MRVALTASLLLVAGLTGCLGDEGGIDSESGPGGGGRSTDASPFDSSTVSNEPGSFQYAGGVGAKSDSERYTWINPGPRALVQWSGGASSGSFTLTVSDAAGQQVYTVDVDGTTSGALQENTGLGVPGPWSLEFQFASFTGGMGLQVTTG